MRLVFSFIAFFCLVCCNPKGEDYRIFFDNNSDLTLRWDWGEQYPQDSLYCVSHIKSSTWRVSPHTATALSWGTEKSISWLNSFMQGKEYLSFYFFDDSVVNKSPQQEIVDNYCILVRYDFTRENLETELEWQISFPPSERMSKVHMWPPYDEVVALYGNN